MSLYLRPVFVSCDWRFSSFARHSSSQSSLLVMEAAPESTAPAGASLHGEPPGTWVLDGIYTMRTPTNAEGLTTWRVKEVMVTHAHAGQQSTQTSLVPVALLHANRKWVSRCTPHQQRCTTQSSRACEDVSSARGIIPGLNTAVSVDASERPPASLMLGGT